MQLNSLGGVGIVAGVCTQTPRIFASLRLAFRGLRGCDFIPFRRHKSLFVGRWRGEFGIESQPLSTDPGHDLGAHCGTPREFGCTPGGDNFLSSLD